ncbi:MliC family protein [Paraburkholderia acidisoli]|uniref:Lysozyme inhibitor n=1 Tax=Paraburkholderia acidisoli TaxID=2571748 RepID=A0A7Z2GFR6_9BURK|nr:MliC family protein [Paraburkholderia acidisoli]QGZ60977.1 lysozyme inhibitor [Paraburkholderia acidisoli]
MIHVRAGARSPVSFSSRLKWALALAGALTAFAAPLAQAASGGASLEVPGIKVQTRHTFSYTCASGANFKVTYFNAANGQSFALVPVDGRKLLFVGVIAASGVRYVADRYTWWTKGPGADLYDTASGDSAKPVLAGCATIMR